jgi:hypothetical protein
MERQGKLSGRLNQRSPRLREEEEEEEAEEEAAAGAVRQFFQKIQNKSSKFKTQQT